MAVHPHVAALNAMEEAGKESGGIIVSWSGGKDSRVIASLALRTGLKVSAFFMEFLPGLPYSDEMCQYAKERFGIEPLRYLHWVTVKSMKAGIFCDAWFKRDNIEWTLDDIYALARSDTGMRLIATGARSADSGWRRRQMAKGAKPDVIWPLKGWSKFDVLSYLAFHKIPVPDSEKGNATGLDLSTNSVLWLAEKRSTDFEIIKQSFPYVEAVVHREVVPETGEAPMSEVEVSRGARIPRLPRR